MTFMMWLSLLCFLMGLVAVASNPSPYFAALGLVIVSGVGCTILVEYGGTFLSLILFLIYLGGMLVVFAYSAALAAEPFPETLGSLPVLFSIVCMVGAVGAAGVWVSGDWYEGAWVGVDETGTTLVGRGDMLGVGGMYEAGGWVLLLGAGALLLTLFVVLELTRGSSRGALRAI
uniref:NADH-ubiquinone oxidoreductase chain 6 n=1 Tax=Asterorhombus intermedius TaxID=1461741 RepID=A0A5B9XX59_9PLEU|nr:NADH dehydrogenase subunit 6 [Asterorhombus intermedius]QEH58981.1 NADH dehydrogenase subunit 6 [Asterorhombus intermedius]